GSVQVDHRIGTESGTDAVAPALVLQRLVVGQVIGGRVGCAQDLDVEPLEQGPGRKIGLGQFRLDVIVNALGALAGELFRHAEHIDHLVGQPKARRSSSEQVKVLGEGLPDLAVVGLVGAAVPGRYAEGLKGNPLA